MICITQSDSRYPKLLQHIPSPPKQLYANGNIALLDSQRTIAVVGSRKATAYGKQVVRDAVPHLVAADCVVVSGLAFGIDAIAHTTTLDHEGSTIAVLGSSAQLDEVTPRTNQHIARRILQSGGLLLSEYPPGTIPYASHFPERNRIIAGLSIATVVVEGGLRSGSLITARQAIEYNRELFAVPGHITAPLSAGPNRLLSQGAIPWTSHEVLFEHLGHALHTSDAGTPKQTLLLSETEQLVIELFRNEEYTIDEAIDARPDSLQPHQVIQATMSLLVKGAITEMGANRYIAS